MSSSDQGEKNKSLKEIKLFLLFLILIQVFSGHGIGILVYLLSSIFIIKAIQENKDKWVLTHVIILISANPFFDPDFANKIWLVVYTVIAIVEISSPANLKAKIGHH